MNNKKRMKKKMKKYNAPGLHTTMLTFHSLLGEHTMNEGTAVALAHN